MDEEEEEGKRARGNTRRCAGGVPQREDSEVGNKGKLRRGTCEGREKERGGGERAHTDTMRQVEWVPVRGEGEGGKQKDK